MARPSGLRSRTARSILALIAGAVIGAAGAAPQPPKLPPQPPALAAEVRAVLTPAAYTNLQRESAKARAYFRPNTILTRTYDERSTSTAEGPSDKNRTCTLRFFPKSSNNVSTTESSFKRVRTTAYVEEITTHVHGVYCGKGQAGAGADADVPTFSQLSVLIANVDARSAFGKDDFQLTAELDPSSPEKRTVNFSGRNIEGLCSELRRWRPGQWNANFPFTLYEMQCNAMMATPPGSNQIMTVTRTSYFSPELSAELICGVKGTTSSSLMNMYQSFSNIEVVQDGNLIRVKCNTESTSISMTESLPTVTVLAKGEAEDLITVD
jgi:hypothetical protein